MSTGTDKYIAALVGKPYAQPGSPEHAAGTGFDCWSLARAAMQILGWHLPETPAEAFAQRGRTMTVPAAAACQTGDIIEIICDGTVHVGIALDPFRFIHATKGRGVAVDKIAAAQRGGMVRAVHRLHSAATGGPA